MPYCGLSSELPKISKEEAFKTHAALPFMVQNAWTCQNADKYVKTLLDDAPEAKTAVKDKLAVVTGVTIGGAGYHVAQELAIQAEMHVVLMGRNEAKLTAAIASIERTGEKRGCDDKPTLYETKYDLNSLKSVQDAADYVTKLAKDKYEGKLYVLVNNAGAAVPTYGTTEEGIEWNVGRNYVAPHLLTSLLLPLLKNAATDTYKPRVVHVASIGHALGATWDPAKFEEDPALGGAQDGIIDTSKDPKEFKGMMGGGTMYGNAKYGLVGDAVHLTKLHPEINFTSQQPGSIASNFGASLGFFGTVYYYGFYLFQYTPSQGARASLRAALDPDFNTVQDLQGAYLHCANPWPPQDPKVNDPTTGQPYTLEAYGKVLYETVDRVIQKLLSSKK